MPYLIINKGQMVRRVLGETIEPGKAIVIESIDDNTLRALSLIRDLLIIDTAMVKGLERSVPAVQNNPSAPIQAETGISDTLQIRIEEPVSADTETALDKEIEGEATEVTPTENQERSEETKSSKEVSVKKRGRPKKKKSADIEL